MDNNDKFPEQKAPEKNTDDAFVKVRDDGSPAMPTSDNTKKDNEKEEHVTTLDKR